MLPDPANEQTAGPEIPNFKPDKIESLSLGYMKLPIYILLGSLSLTSIQTKARTSKNNGLLLEGPQY